MSPIFDQDFRRVFRANCLHNKTPGWDGSIQFQPEDRMKDVFSAYLTPRVVQILSSPDVPTFKDIKSISWDRTVDVGVYAITLEWGDSKEMEGHVFIGGTATAHGGGLEGRKFFHLKALKENRSASFLGQLWTLNPVRRPKVSFHTLLRYPLLENSSLPEKHRADFICELSTAMLQSWFGTFNFSAKEELVQISPFHPYNRLEWAGVNTGFHRETSLPSKSIDSYLDGHFNWMEIRHEFIQAVLGSQEQPLLLWKKRTTETPNSRETYPKFSPYLQLKTPPVPPNEGKVTPEWLEGEGIEISPPSGKRIQTFGRLFGKEFDPQIQAE